jgi:hypothetical protein
LPFGFKEETKIFLQGLTDDYHVPARVDFGNSRGVSCSHLARAWAKVLLRAPAFAQKKLFSASLKISTVFLSGFLSSKRKELGGRT